MILDTERFCLNTYIFHYIILVIAGGGRWCAKLKGRYDVQVLRLFETTKIVLL